MSQNTNREAPFIELRRVSKIFKNQVESGLKPTSLSIDRGKFITILGTSGSGKTTLLKLINRLYEPTSGEIRINAQNIALTPATALRRQIGYVVQQVGLFPHMTVAQNIATVPEILGWNKARIASRIDELLTLVELNPAEFRDRYPAQLSGGQQQRVGLARALAGDPAILLMDEPFGAIDSLTRLNLQAELLRIQRKLKKTIIFVTHDIPEALKLGDQVIVMHAGEVQQYDTPLQLLSHPANEFVRTLLDTDEPYQQLDVIPIRHLVTRCTEEIEQNVPRISEEHSLKDALALMLDSPYNYVAVEDHHGKLIGIITLENLKAARRKWPSHNASSQDVCHSHDSCPDTACSEFSCTGIS
jgi:osmoprotectant transport system ATP-binding protein